MAMLGVVLGIVGLAGVSSPAHANGTVDAFVNRWNGSYADYDGAYGAQCVDLFNYYNRDVVKAPRIAVNYAAQLFGAAPSVVRPVQQVHRAIRFARRGRVPT